MRRIASTLLSLCVVPCLLACAGTSQEEQQATAEHHASRNEPRKHVMVQITDMSVHPKTAHILPGGTVSWLNRASLQATIVFSDQVASGFDCDLRPTWMKTGTGYQSIPITMGGASNDIVTPCGLKPGEYEYEVWLFSSLGGMDPAEMGNPQQRFSGKIIVK